MAQSGTQSVSPFGKVLILNFCGPANKRNNFAIKNGEEGSQMSGKNCTNWSILCQELAKQGYLHLESFRTQVNSSTWLLAFVFTCFPFSLKYIKAKLLNLSWELVDKAYLHLESFRAQFQPDVQVYSCKLPKYLDAYQSKTRQTAHMSPPHHYAFMHCVLGNLGMRLYGMGTRRINLWT